MLLVAFGKTLSWSSIWRHAIFSIACFGVILAPATAAQIDIAGPAGSGAFGTTVTVLPDSNIVVTDPNATVSSVSGAGAVYVYTPNGVLISTLSGSSTNDHVGNGGISVLNNGDFVIISSSWGNAGAANAGAVTWVDGSTGLSGAISSSNSLVGTSAGDMIGSDGLTILDNGNFVITSTHWSNAGAANAGAVTWVDQNTGIAGVVSSGNSLVGTTAGDTVGSGGYFGGGITILANGNFVITSQNWSNAGAANAGAVTWVDENIGIVGAVSSANSLVGTSAGDAVGSDYVTPLSNGNYVVGSSYWASVGAATWANGTTGISGVVSSINSLVGTTGGDSVGVLIQPLANGNYVVTSSSWNNGSASSAGAVTWANGSTGLSGAVSAANSLVGTQTNDLVGGYGYATELGNGNFVVRSPYWNNGSAAQAGAVTWVDASVGTSGAVSPANSLVGSTANDKVGYGVTALSNGNYVVASRYWSNGAASNVGAVTWADGSTGIVGTVSSSNSLVGSTANDFIGSGIHTTGSPDFRAVTALSNGNYVVSSPFWADGSANAAGAVTWGDGSSGISGAVSPANSLTGSTANDQIGYGGITALSNGSYVVASRNWSNGAASNAGAVTWADGSTGIFGAVSSTNSLVGSRANDYIGCGSATSNNGHYDTTAVLALSNGNYVVRSPYWTNSSTNQPGAGAVTWGNGSTGVSGAVSPTNSLVGREYGDQVGYGGVIQLANGNYVVASPGWFNVSANANSAGAVTLGNGSSGISGAVSAVNSLVGTSFNDAVGGYSDGMTALNDGNYVVYSQYWNNGAAAYAGAISLAQGSSNLTGPILAANSVRGTVANGGSGLVFAYDATRDQLVVGQPSANMISVFSYDFIFINGFQ